MRQRQRPTTLSDIFDIIDKSSEDHESSWEFKVSSILEKLSVQDKNRDVTKKVLAMIKERM